MEKRHVVFGSVALGVLVAGLVGYGACMMEIGEEGETLGEVPPMPDAGLPTFPPELDDPPIEGAEFGRPSEVPGLVPGHPVIPRPQPEPTEPGEVTIDLPVDPSLDQLQAGEGRLTGPTACGGLECSAEEICCVREGRCYPRTCLDCCGEEGQPRPGPTGQRIPDPRER